MVIFELIGGGSGSNFIISAIVLRDVAEASISYQLALHDHDSQVQLQLQQTERTKKPNSES